MSQDQVLERQVLAGTTAINQDPKQNQRKASTGAAAYQGRARQGAHDPDRLLPPFNQWLQNGHKMATKRGQGLVAIEAVSYSNFGSGTGIRTLNLAVNRLVQPVQKWQPEFAECR
ncbi:MAG: hypothetical protein ACYDA0_12760 [Candidatus Dormibacteraceae bacterium]